MKINTVPDFINVFVSNLQEDVEVVFEKLNEIVQDLRYCF